MKYLASFLKGSLLSLVMSFTLLAVHSQIIKPSFPNPWQDILITPDTGQIKIDSICRVRGHIYEETQSSDAYVIQELTDTSGTGIINLSNLPTTEANNFKLINQTLTDSFKVYIDMPDSTYLVWRYKQVTKFCYRCLRYIEQPAIPDKYIKTLWKAN